MHVMRPSVAVSGINLFRSLANQSQHLISPVYVLRVSPPKEEQWLSSSFLHECTRHVRCKPVVYPFVFDGCWRRKKKKVFHSDRDFLCSVYSNIYTVVLVPAVVHSLHAGILQSISSRASKTVLYVISHALIVRDPLQGLVYVSI